MGQLIYDYTGTGLAHKALTPFCFHNCGAEFQSELYLYSAPSHRLCKNSSILHLFFNFQAKHLINIEFFWHFNREQHLSVPLGFIHVGLGLPNYRQLRQVPGAPFWLSRGVAPITSVPKLTTLHDAAIMG